MTTVVWDDGLAERELASPEALDIIELVDALDGREHTLVTVYRGNAHVAVGGSAASGLVVYVTFDGTTFHQLVSSGARSDDQVTVAAGGQPGDYPRRFVVDAPAAKAALRAFFERFVLDPGQDWEAS